MTDFSRPSSVLVTGAASGVGQHAATRYAAAGSRVTALDVDQDGLDSLAKTSELITPVRCDVGDAAAVRAAAAAAGPVEHLVHCAGIAPLGRLLDQPAADLERAIRTNYLGTVHVTQAVVPRMVEQGRGTVIVIASIAAWIPLTDVGAYSASKAAVAAFCEVLAAECRSSGVRLTCVCPSAIETPMLQNLRCTHPEVVNGRPGLPPSAILDAAEAALRKNRLYVFPGRGNTTLWRARRLAPGPLNTLLDIIVKRQSPRTANEPAHSPITSA
jgi:NAD(P)-dependent dehydrogenase (short-subunit alcohol dehydrogenase family)